MVGAWSEHGRRMLDGAWMEHGWSIDGSWMEHGLSMVSAWMEHGWSIDGSWMEHGLSMDGAWMEHGRSMVSAWMEHRRSIVGASSEHRWSDQRRFSHLFRLAVKHHNLSFRLHKYQWDKSIGHRCPRQTCASAQSRLHQLPSTSGERALYMIIKQL